MTERVAVVGGGAVGVTAAHDLATRGADVTLYERDDVASGASGRAAGIVYDAYAEDHDAAVADRAIARFREHDADGAISFTPCPYVWLAREGDDHAATAIRNQIPRMQAHDRDVDLLDPAELAEHFPALETDDVAVAAVAHDAGYLDTTAYVAAMADRAREAGAAIRTDAEVTLVDDGEATPVVETNGTSHVIETDETPPVVETGDDVESFDSVLVAAGANSKSLLADVGVPIAMKPYRVQALVTDPIDALVPMTYDATGGYYFRPRDGGVLVGDGTEEREFDPDDYDETADEAFEDASLARLRDAIAGETVEPSVRRSWAGLCTATPDRDPLLGPVDDGEAVFVATGWHGHGFMRAPALGEAVTGWILDGDPLPAFDPRRFDGDESFDVVEGMTVEE